MIVIDAIASYVPERRESNFDRAADLGVSREFIVDKLGVEQVSRRAADEETSDLCVRAFEALEKQTDLARSAIDCLIVCTQNPDGGGIPHTSAVIHGKLDLPDRCASFDISLGCSGYVYGLAVVTAFMQTNGFSAGLLFTADPYSKIIDPDDKNTVLLFGDAATVTLLRERDEAAGRLAPRRFRFATKGRNGDALHNRDKRLVMDGRAVFNFSATRVPVQVRELLDDLGLTSDDIDLFLFHQGSRFIVEHLRSRLALPPAKVPIEIAAHGNTVSSSLPLLLEAHVGAREVRNIVMSGFGVGLSWATCLLTRGQSGGGS